MSDFIERYRPRHEALELLQTVLKSEEPVLKAFSAFTAVADTTRTRPDNLLDLYLGSSRELLQDVARRPDHYSAEHKDIIDRLANRPETVTVAEKNSVFMAWQRPKELEAKTQSRIRELTSRRLREQQRKEDEEIVLGDGRTLAAHLEDPSFESQDFGDKVII